MIWKISVPTSGIACSRPRGCRPVVVNRVRYTNCAMCAVELKQANAPAKVDLVEEPDEGADIVVHRRCKHDGAQESTAIAEARA